MIEVLLTTGVWIEIFKDESLTTDDLSQIAYDSNLRVGTCLCAVLPDGTMVDCSKIAAVRFNH